MALCGLHRAGREGCGYFNGQPEKDLTVREKKTFCDSLVLGCSSNSNITYPTYPLFQSRLKSQVLLSLTPSMFTATFFSLLYVVKVFMRLFGSLPLMLTPTRLPLFAGTLFDSLARYVTPLVFLCLSFFISFASLICHPPSSLSTGRCCFLVGCSTAFPLVWPST